MPEIAETSKNDLLAALLEGNNFNRIIDCAARLLRNPVAVFDTSYHIIAHSRTYNVIDPTWREGIRQGYWDYEIIAKVRRRLTLQKNPDDPVIIGGISPLRRRFSRLNMGGIHLGYFVVLEYNDALEKISDEIYRFTGSILAKELAAERPVILHNRDQVSESIMADLLNAGFPNRLLFRERIAGTPLDLQTTFQVVMVDLNSYATGKLQDEHLKCKISELLPYSWSIIDDSYVVVLIDRGHRCYAAFQPLEHFEEYLRETGIRAALSGTFADLFLFPEFCSQAVRTLELAALFPEPKQLIPSDDYKLLQIISEIPQGRIEYYCSEIVLKIRDYDASNNTDYLRTLFFYLHTGRSVQQTAALLHIHRNTVTYRVERIKELFALDFSKEFWNFQNYLSYIMLVYQNKVDATLDHT